MADQDEEHGHRQGQRGVQVRGGHHAEIGVVRRLGARGVGDQERRQIQRDQVHRVHEDHPHEDGQRQRRHRVAVAVEGVLDLAVDEFHHQLDEGLTLGRHPGGGAAGEEREPGHKNQAQRQRD
ncbi:hypothetical protein QE438_003457 [Pseudoxanthomonas sp. SORGH_AS 997]|nr:hypothetical protein [Pseudoxanthomonas sp. SORGH_AS_0997]